MMTPTKTTLQLQIYLKANKMQTTIWEKMKGTATKIGDLTSFLIGLFFIFKIGKFVANTIINSMIISYAFGSFNYRIFFSYWDHLVSLFLHQENVNQMNARRRDKQSERIEVNDPTITGSATEAKKFVSNNGTNKLNQFT
jgi:hypothetical protein